VKKTDARGVVTTMNYDSLNRILTKSYSDGTPGVGYLYDTDVSATDASSLFHGEEGVRWDGAGRAVASRRVSAVSGQKDSVATSYASSIGYAAHGALASMTLGNGLQESWDYSAKRLQARRVRVGTTGEWQFSYCAGSYTAECAQNNGNVLSEVILPLNATQTFTYDPLSRLKTFVDSGGPRQTYVYDRYGNRALIGGTANGNYVPAAPPTPQVTNDDPAQAAAIFAGNRWVGSTADAAGNLTQPATGAYPQLSFDAENRVKSAVTGLTASENYFYDGEARRVKKVAGNVTTVYVYDAQGKLAAEYATVAPAESGPQYLTVDHLGSTRLVTGAGGVVDKRYDYLPFGQELVAGVGGRTSALRYLDGAATDGQRVRFTGQVRDVESGLDYFGARYFSGAQGRFTSPDPASASAKPSDPQTWNRYAYVTNNPLRYVDPDGRDRMEILLNQDVHALVRGQITRKEYEDRLKARGQGALVAAGLLSGYAAAATSIGRGFLTAAIGWALGHPREAQEIAASTTETVLGVEGPSAPRIVPTGDIDEAATALAKRLGGHASVMIEGFGNREFDAVSREFVGQTFGAASALLKPDNFLSKDRKEQIRATLEAARATGRQAYFEFRKGVHDDVMAFIRRNAERIGVGYEVRK